MGRRLGIMEARYRRGQGAVLGHWIQSLHTSRVHDTATEVTHCLVVLVSQGKTETCAGDEYAISIIQNIPPRFQNEGHLLSWFMLPRVS
jgi:hypothetical protein